MYNNNYGGLFAFVIVIGVLLFILYLIAIFATVFVAAAAAGGTIYGGKTAVGNYFSSFKENMIDSNKVEIA